MALDIKSVEAVKELFTELFPGRQIYYANLNQYGADEVYLYPPSSLQTPDIGRIYDVSRKIGNTVSVMVKENRLLVCFW